MRDRDDHLGARGQEQLRFLDDATQVRDRCWRSASTSDVDPGHVIRAENEYLQSRATVLDPACEAGDPVESCADLLTRRGVQVGDEDRPVDALREDVVQVDLEALNRDYVQDDVGEDREVEKPDARERDQPIPGCGTFEAGRLRCTCCGDSRVYHQDREHTATSPGTKMGYRSAQLVVSFHRSVLVDRPLPASSCCGGCLQMIRVVLAGADVPC